MNKGESETKTKRPPATCGDDHGLAVWFTPDAVREHFQEGDDPTVDDRLAAVTDDDLAGAAGNALLSFDDLWRVFDEMTGYILDEAERIAKERAAKTAPGATA